LTQTEFLYWCKLYDYVYNLSFQYIRSKQAISNYFTSDAPLKMEPGVLGTGVCFARFRKKCVAAHQGYYFCVSFVIKTENTMQKISPENSLPLLRNPKKMMSLSYELISLSQKQRIAKLFIYGFEKKKF